MKSISELHIIFMLVLSALLVGCFIFLIKSGYEFFSKKYRKPTSIYKFLGFFIAFIVLAFLISNHLFVGPPVVSAVDVALS